jgi:hypothetical protein
MLRGPNFGNGVVWWFAYLNALCQTISLFGLETAVQMDARAPVVRREHVGNGRHGGLWVPVIDMKLKRSQGGDAYTGAIAEFATIVVHVEDAEEDDDPVSEGLGFVGGWLPHPRSRDPALLPLRACTDDVA